MSKFKYFVLLANMRTGSNLFERTIESFDSFACHGELFNPHFIGYPTKESKLKSTVEQRHKNPVSLIDEMIGLDNQVLHGFRLFSNHDPRIIEHCLNDESCAKIILTRNPMDSFVSYEIAMETDQWKMGDLHRRREAKVDFDFDKFQNFLRKRKQNADMIKRSLQQTGQTAFHLTYEDLSDISVFNGLSKFLGSGEIIKSFGERGSRQNPESLKQKITNYAEMQEQVRTLNIFEPEVEPFIEPRQPENSKNIFIGKTSPVAYFSVSNAPIDETTRWMQSLEPDGAAPLTSLAGAEVRKWLIENNHKVVLTCLEHPVERAYNAFNNLLLFKGIEGMNWIRNMMTNFYGMHLPPNHLRMGTSRDELINAGYDLGTHRANFRKFLPFLAGNLKGQTRAPVMPAWCSQYSKIQSFARWAHPHFIVPPHRRAETFSYIEKQFGLVSAPQEPIQKPEQCFNLADIYNPQIEKLTRNAYASDYQNYNFEDWSETD